MTSKQFPINKNLFTSLIKTTIFSPIFIVIIFASLFIFTSEMALAEEAINEVSSPFKNWFDRDTRSPKPKFIRFGRSAGNNQKFIRFGRTPSMELVGGDPSTEVENLDDLIDVVEGLYPSERLRQQQESPSMTAVYLTAPKRAQKFIRFGKK